MVVKKKIFGTKKRPRISVFRSNRHIYAQIVDDEKRKTLVSASSLRSAKKGAKKEPAGKIALKVGRLLAESAKKKKIKRAVFDRRKYKYHGRVKALAEGAREGGLDF
jgi:large subunit ribosomal protein L18